jgi:hypothetical protein
VAEAEAREGIDEAAHVGDADAGGLACIMEASAPPECAVGVPGRAVGVERR